MVGRQKSLFPGALIGPKSFFYLTFIACTFEIYAARCCNRAAEDTPRAQQHTSLLIPCAHGKLNVKHYRTTPKPETHITSRGRSCAGEKIENRAPKRIQAHQQQQQRHSHHYPSPPRLPPTRTTRHSKEHNFWVELVRVCRLAVVAAAAACCSFRDYENPPPPNEARAIRREGRRAVSAQLAGTVVRTCMIFWPWVGPFCE